MCDAADPSRFSVPTERLALEWRAGTVKTRIELWSLSCYIKQGEFGPPRNQPIWRLTLQEIPCAKEHGIQRRVWLLLARCTLDQFSDVPGNCCTLEAGA
jgi:hypothetical protein